MALELMTNKMVGSPGGRELPPPEPGVFIQCTKTRAKVREGAPRDHWEMLMKPFSRAAAVYNNICHDEKTTVIIATELCSTNVLCMPVCTSPFVVAASMWHGSSPALYTSAIETLYELMRMRFFMKDVAYSREKNPVNYGAVQKLDETLERELETSQLILKSRLDTEAYFPFRDKLINQQQCVLRFVKCLEDHTMFMIHRFEAFIFDALYLNLPEGHKCEIRLCNVLTATATQSGSLPTGADLMSLEDNGVRFKILIASMQNMFAMRTTMYNARMRREAESTGNSSYRDIQLFNTADLMARTQQALYESTQNPSRSRIYRGWLLYETAREYCDMLNLEFVDEQTLRLRTQQESGKK